MTVMRIINEPTAAAIAYGMDKKEGEKKEGESSSAASGATSAPSMVVGEELNEMVKNIMGSYSPTLHRHFYRSSLELPCSFI